jgi:hypothetical protein
LITPILTSRFEFVLQADAKSRVITFMVDGPSFDGNYCEQAGEANFVALFGGLKNAGQHCLKLHTSETD